MPDPSRAVVSDTGPFISLEKLPDGFALIRQLYDRVFIPKQVLLELAAGSSAPERYLKRHGIDDLVEVVPVVTGDPDLIALDPGERDAVALALEKKLPLLIEELAGRDVAAAKGLKYSGIAGQVIKAGKLGLLDHATVLLRLRQLHEANRINRELLKRLTGSLGKPAVKS